MKNILAISFFLFGSSAFALDCGGGDDLLGANEDSYELWCERDGVRQGPYELWSIESGLTVKANYSGGQLEGLFLRFDSGGQVVVEGRFHDGEPDGVWRRHFPNGRLKDRGEWRQGRPTGRWEFFTESGRKVREFDFSSETLTPHWQFGLGVSRVEQPLGQFTSGVALVTRCFWCENWILVPRLEASVSWLKLQEEGVGLTGGLHIGLDFAIDPVVFRPLFGFEYLNSEHFENSYGLELTRAIGKRFRSTDFQPFLRYLHVDLGASSDLDVFQAGLWIKL
jgi:hypothetical protein